MDSLDQQIKRRFKEIKEVQELQEMKTFLDSFSDEIRKLLEDTESKEQENRIRWTLAVVLWYSQKIDKLLSKN